jgi:hypothetical protein
MVLLKALSLLKIEATSVLRVLTMASATPAGGNAAPTTKEIDRSICEMLSTMAAASHPVADTHCLIKSEVDLGSSKMANDLSVS